MATTPEMKGARFGGSTLPLLLLLGAAAAAATATATVPQVPASAALGATSGDRLHLGWTPPASDGGSAVTSYKVEWDADPGRQEVQSITTRAFTGPNEVVTITTSAADVNEVQIVKSTATEVREVQTVRTTCNPFNTLSGTFTLKLDTTATGGGVETSGVIAHQADACADASGAANACTNNVAGSQSGGGE